MEAKSWPYSITPPILVGDWGLQMKKRMEAATEGFTLRALMGMAVPLAEALGNLQTLVAQYDALAKANDLPACPNPSVG